ncbi:MAG: hypothetical protein LBE09_04540, partial [Christensenellaceae bacterium]|nr:hypothetical protein [Christensenellaceae bacterium]
MVDIIERVLTDDEAREILQKPYKRYNLQLLLYKFLIQDFQFRNTRIEPQLGELFEKITKIGFSKTLNLAVYEVILQKDAHEKRIKITQHIFSVLREHLAEYSLIIFDPGDGTYRLSLLTCTFEYDEKGFKAIGSSTNFRRLSYNLGDRAKTRMPFEFLIKKGRLKAASELLERFSVEIVNKRFYNEIVLMYTQLIGGDRGGTQHPGVLKIRTSNDNALVANFAEFAVRLIGRLVFCRFLCEAKSINGISLMNENLFTKDAILNSDGNYYQNILVPLFFRVLNTKEDDRSERIKSEEKYRGIPYLGGGLFSRQIDDGVIDTKNNVMSAHTIQIPNSRFLELFDILNQYNFIVDENTSYDVDLSIDPEMLGRIFENLLAEINPETGASARKSTGSFYTPREIVDYMVDSTLLEYLKDKTAIPEDKLENLITYNRDENSPSLTYDERESIINSLFSLTVLDPACGSGAFPIGVLQKIVYVLQEVDPSAEFWIDRVCRDGATFFKEEIREKFEINALDYIRKLSVLQNSIFGVDIQPIAVEIARLRCFLSLVIEEKVLDYEPNRGILPLPNLDFKFVAANALVTLDAGEKISFFENQSHMTALNRVRDEYFNASCARRIELKSEFYDILRTMINESGKNYQGHASKRHEQLSNWNPFENIMTNWFDPLLSLGISS